MSAENRLMQLIKIKSAEAGYSQTKTDKILALVSTAINEGIPEVDDLRSRLESIGRSE